MFYPDEILKGTFTIDNFGNKRTLRNAKVIHQGKEWELELRKYTPFASQKTGEGRIEYN